MDKLSNTIMKMKAAQRKRNMLYFRNRGWTLVRIGKKYGISRERVRQIIGNTGRIAKK